MDEHYAQAVIDRLDRIIELLEQAPEQVFNVFVQGENVDQARLQGALDRFRK